MNRAGMLRAAIRRLGAALVAQSPVADIQGLVADEARLLTSATSAAICLLTDDRDHLDFVAASGENAGEIVGMRIRLADSLAGTVVENGAPLLVATDDETITPDLFTTSDAYPGSSESPASAARPSSGLRSAAIVPLLMENRLIGTLAVLSRTASGGFTSEDIDTLAILGDYVVLSRMAEGSRRSVREQTRELDVLYDAARNVAGSLNVQEVMESVLEAVCAHVEHQSAVLLLLNDEKTHLFIVADRGLTEDEREVQLAVDDGPHSSVIHSGQPWMTPDMDETSEFQSISERAAPKSAMIAPIRSREETHGIIVLTSARRSAYSEDDVQLLSAVAMQAGIAIENAWLFEGAQRQAEEAAALFELSRHVNSTFRIDDVLDFVADSVVNLLKVDRFALMLYDADRGRLVTRLSRHIDRELFERVQPRQGEGIAGWVFEWQTPQAVADVAADSRNRLAPIDQAGVASTLCVPMQVGEDVIGVIHAMNAHRRLFTVGEMELLYTIANQAAVAIVNATLYREARVKSHEMRRRMRRIAQAVGCALDEQNMPRLLADLAAEVMQADRCAVYRLDGDMLVLEAASGFRSGSQPEARTPLGHGLAGWAAKRGHSLVVDRLDADPRSRVHPWLLRDRLASYLAVPLKNGRQTTGVIEVYTQEPRSFSKEEVHLLASFARRARASERISDDGREFSPAPSFT